MRIAKYGPGSEKLSDAQLELLELEPGVSSVEVQAESERPAVQPAAKTEVPASRPARTAGESSACREDIDLHARAMRVPGLRETNDSDRPRGKLPTGCRAGEVFRIDQQTREACLQVVRGTGCGLGTAAPRIIEKCLASDQIVIDTVVSKYCDHQPLYRQSAMLERDSGVELSRATLDGWVLKVGELLIPMASAMRQELIRGTYIQADETPVDVQMHEGRGKNHQAYLWQYSRPGGTALFDFRLGRGREGPKQFLGQFEGLLQTDGYAAYDQIGGPKIVHAGCWSHSERYFSEAVQLNPQDQVRGWARPNTASWHSRRRSS